MSSQIIDGLATFGQISAIVYLFFGILIGLALIIAGILVMARNKQFGLGTILIIFGLLSIIGGVLWYYFATYNKTTGTIAGVVAIADIIGGSKKEI